MPNNLGPKHCHWFREGIAKNKMNDDNSYVSCGLPYNVMINKKLEENERVTIEFPNFKSVFFTA